MDENLPATERELSVLKDPRLFDLITVDEFNKRIEGDIEARKAIFLFCCISLVKNKGSGAANNLLVNAGPSTGKDYITRNITRIFPSERVEALNRASPNAFTYWKTNEDGFSWDGKICRLTDVPTGLLKSDAFKTFLSDEEKSVIVNKNKTGTIGAVEYAVSGRPVVIATTANADPNDEILNRFNIIALDETTDQTRAITRRRLREAAGKQSDNADYSLIVENALKQLKVVSVDIPFAEDLEDYLPNDVRSRRDVPRILNLIRASAAVHQYQRETKDGVVLANETDYEIARRALLKIQTGAFVNLTRALKRIWETIQKWVDQNPRGRFTVKEIHAFNPLCSERQYYDHLEKLSELGFLTIHYERRGGDAEGYGGKEVMTFEITNRGLQSISLPEYSKIAKKTSINSIPSTPSIPSKPSNSENGHLGFEAFEGFEVRN